MIEREGEKLAPSEGLTKTQTLALAAPATASLPRVLHAIARAPPLNIRSDQPRTRNGLCQQPKRKHERQGRAQCNCNRTKLGRVVEPRVDENRGQLARIAFTAGKIERVVESRVRMQQVEGSADGESDEHNNTRSSQAPPLLRCSLHRVRNNPRRIRLRRLHVPAITVG